MIIGRKCKNCNGTGMVECTAGTQEGSFSPDEMPCVHCCGTGGQRIEPQNKEEAAIMLADALELATQAKATYQNFQHVYARWKMGINRDEDGHRL